MSVNTVDKFGKVYILKEGTIAYKILDNAEFSNLNLSVLVDNRKSATLYGKKYSLGIFGHQLKAPIELGMSEVVNMDLFEDAYVGHVNTLKQIGLLDDGDAKKFEEMCGILKENKFHINSVLASAGKYSHEMELMNKMLAFTYVDDLLECGLTRQTVETVVNCRRQELSCPHKREHEKLPYEFLSGFMICLAKALQGDGKDSMDIFKENTETVEAEMLNIQQICAVEEGNIEEPKSQESKRKLITTLIRGCNLMRKEALDTAIRRSLSEKDFLKSFATYLENAALESSYEWNVDLMGGPNAVKMISVVANLRHISVGGIVYLEALLLQNGIHIGDDLRHTALFKIIVTLVGTHCQKTQDFLSFRKEIEGEGNEWRGNEACVLHKAKGFSETEAMAKLVKDANQILEQFEQLCLLLVNTFKKDEKRKLAEQFVYQAKRTMLIYIQGCAIINRYHRNLTMDCYVDL